MVITKGSQITELQKTTIDLDGIKFLICLEKLEIILILKNKPKCLKGWLNYQL